MMSLQAEINLLLQSLPALLACHREAEAAPHATDNAEKPGAEAATSQISVPETPADGLHKSIISRLAQACCPSSSAAALLHHCCHFEMALAHRYEPAEVRYHSHAQEISLQSALTLCKRNVLRQ